MGACSKNTRCASDLLQGLTDALDGARLATALTDSPSHFAFTKQLADHAAMLFVGRPPSLSTPQHTHCCRSTSTKQAVQWTDFGVLMQHYNKAGSSW